jgi:hypothetical protein
MGRKPKTNIDRKLSTAQIKSSYDYYSMMSKHAAFEKEKNKRKYRKLKRWRDAKRKNKV